MEATIYERKRRRARSLESQVHPCRSLFDTPAALRTPMRVTMSRHNRCFQKRPGALQSRGRGTGPARLRATTRRPTRRQRWQQQPDSGQMHSRQMTPGAQWRRTRGQPPVQELAVLAGQQSEAELRAPPTIHRETTAARQEATATRARCRCTRGEDSHPPGGMRQGHTRDPTPERQRRRPRRCRGSRVAPRMR